MTLEDLKKHIRPLEWKEEPYGSLRASNYIMDDRGELIFKRKNGEWMSCSDCRAHQTKEEAMQAVEEYHIRELAKFFELEED